MEFSCMTPDVLDKKILFFQESLQFVKDIEYCMYYCCEGDWTNNLFHHWNCSGLASVWVWEVEDILEGGLLSSPPLYLPPSHLLHLPPPPPTPGLPRLTWFGLRQPDGGEERWGDGLRHRKLLGGARELTPVITTWTDGSFWVWMGSLALFINWSSR